ncbi:MAG: Uncharacterised protein [SAR116 cluster bacterium]|nr:MAG: Uncharacterised protein [SAR116 cluster bacterium]
MTAIVPAVPWRQERQTSQSSSRDRQTARMYVPRRRRYSQGQDGCERPGANQAGGVPLKILSVLQALPPPEAALESLHRTRPLPPARPLPCDQNGSANARSEKRIHPCRYQSRMYRTAPLEGAAFRPDGHSAPAVQAYRCRQDPPRQHPRKGPLSKNHWQRGQSPRSQPPLLGCPR